MWQPSTRTKLLVNACQSSSQSTNKTEIETAVIKNGPERSQNAVSHHLVPEPVPNIIIDSNVDFDILQMPIDIISDASSRLENNETGIVCTSTSLYKDDNIIPQNKSYIVLGRGSLEDPVVEVNDHYSSAFLETSAKVNEFNLEIQEERDTDVEINVNFESDNPKTAKNINLGAKEIMRDDDQDADFEMNDTTDESIVSEETADTSESGVEDDNHLHKERRRSKNGQNKKRINQKLREEGKAYIGHRRPRSQSNTFHDAQRNSRKMGPRCISNFCKKSTKRQCETISENTRRHIFENFWANFTWGEKQTYVSSLVTKDDKATTKTEDQSRRNCTLKYTLRINNDLVPVCKKMFLSTFGIKEWQVANWISKSVHGMDNQVVVNKVQRKTSNREKGSNFMKIFLENLNKLPSHYCRKETNKLYLEQCFATWADLYQVYKLKCEENNEEPQSRNSLISMVNKMNIALYHPKKDRCDTCCQYEVKNITKEEWDIHIKSKNRAREEKERYKTNAVLGHCHTISMDLQAVKTCPSLQASALYYKTKLCVHNFTIYNLGTKHCKCYWFSEINSDLQASTFATFLVDYIKIFLNDGKPIIIYSDGCLYQNKNAVMANALLHLSKQLGVMIEQKYLVKGHTQMECDSVHATIEKRLKNQIIYLPSDYSRLCQVARKKDPYDVVSVTYKFFKNYSHQNTMAYTSIRPGRKPGDPTLVEVRALRYTSEGTMDFKLHFDDDYKPLPQRCKPIDAAIDFPLLHSCQLKIKKAKFEHLQQLKPVIPTDCWNYYNNLPHDNI